MKRENVQTKLHSLWIYDIHVHTLHISIISQMSMNILNQNLSMTCTRIGIIYIPVLKYYQLTEALKASNLTRWGGKLHQIALYKYCGRWGGGVLMTLHPNWKIFLPKLSYFLSYGVCKPPLRLLGWKLGTIFDHKFCPFMKILWIYH